MDPDLKQAAPCEGAKPYFCIEDIDNTEFLVKFVMETCQQLPGQMTKKVRKHEMAFDYKKEYREFYLPPKKPSLVEVPPMNYIAVRGKGDPNEPDGEYQAAVGLLYAIAFTIKMSDRGSHKIDGYFPYVVPPLEGLWRQDGSNQINLMYKERFEWMAMIRLPDFVTKEEFEWAVSEAAEKKHRDFSKVQFFTYHEGLCVQCMHIGSYDDEPAAIEQMHSFLRENGYAADFSETRQHHEIYLSDPRRTAVEKLRTVIRHPIKPVTPA